MAAAEAAAATAAPAASGKGKRSEAEREAVVGYSDEKKARVYAGVDADLAGFFAKYPGVDTVGRMATLNSFLAAAFTYWHFVGFYVVRTPPPSAAGAAAATPTEERRVLHIGPYQGKVLATAIIAFGKGQCGACAAAEATQVQADVSTCANYIRALFVGLLVDMLVRAFTHTLRSPNAACDDVTRSEIVVPVFGYNYHNEADVPATAGAPRKVRLFALSRRRRRLYTQCHRHPLTQTTAAAHRGAGH